MKQSETPQWMKDAAKLAVKWRHSGDDHYAIVLEAIETAYRKAHAPSTSPSLVADERSAVIERERKAAYCPVCNLGRMEGVGYAVNAGNVVLFECSDCRAQFTSNVTRKQWLEADRALAQQKGGR